MRSRLAVALAALLALLCAAAPAASALDASQVRARLAREIRLAGPASGAYARDLDSGRTIVAVRPGVPRIPASVEKLFTTAAALLRFGASGTLETSAVATAEPDDDGVLPGELYLVGGGDPTLDDAGLRRLAREVHAAGVLSIDGGVTADESRFDLERGTPRTGGAPDPDVGGRLGALVIGRGYQASPALTAGRRFARYLRTVGVDIGRNRVYVGRAPDSARGAQPIATLTSSPITALVAATLPPSDNFLAEMLLKDLGAGFGGHGTTGAGAAVVRTTLAPLGVTPRVVDGSGLSTANRTSPREVVDLFGAMREQDAGPVWRSSMAIPGRTGTVSERMRGSAASRRCRVKTGTLIGVSNLAGICRTPGGDVAFAWLMNKVSIDGAHRLQDRMTRVLAQYSG